MISLRGGVSPVKGFDKPITSSEVALRTSFLRLMSLIALPALGALSRATASSMLTPS